MYLMLNQGKNFSKKTKLHKKTSTKLCEPRSQWFDFWANTA